MDDSDFEWLNQWKWSVMQGKYAHRNAGGGKWVRMHRLIMGEPVGLVVDHINGDTFDNRRINLRVCTQHQNSLNSRVNKNSRSGHKDVFWDRAREKWFVQVMYSGKKHSIGRYSSLPDALAARDTTIEKLHGEFARVGIK